MKKRAMETGTGEAAFTLMEILISSAILALIFVGLITMFRLGRSGWNRLIEREEFSQGYRSAVDRLYTDLKNVFPYSPAKSCFNGTSSGLSFYALVNGYSGHAAVPAYARLAYRFGDSRLARSCRLNSAALDPEAESDTEFDFFAGEYGNAEFSYGKFEESWKWAPSWQDQKGLPDAVKLNVTFADEQSSELIFYVR